jgi:RasGEF domain
MLRKISPQELTAGNWNSRGKEEKSPNVVAFISRFNSFGRHVSFLVIREERLKVRIRVLEQLIQVASHLHEMANYNSLLSVIAGLTASSVDRLKKTWRGVSKSAMQTYEVGFDVSLCTHIHTHLGHDYDPAYTQCSLCAFR